MTVPLTAYTPIVYVDVCEQRFELHRAANLEDLWDSMTEHADSATQTQAMNFDDERLPYWTELWPSSIALSQWLWSQKERITQKKCIDMGCGLGLTSLVGQSLGAKVLGMDYEEEALVFAQKNAVVNHVSQPLWTVMDWRYPAIIPHSIDFLWGGDIMYERRFVQPVLNFIEKVLAQGGRAWIAEPCRSVYEFFRAELLRRRWYAHRVYEATIEPIYAQPVPVTVHVWEIYP